MSNAGIHGTGSYVYSVGEARVWVRRAEYFRALGNRNNAAFCLRQAADHRLWASAIAEDGPQVPVTVRR